MRFGSLFSGIGGFDLGFERAGMTCAWQCEIDPQCRTVLARHWPDVVCHHDVKELHVEPGSVDLVCGGFPCQDLSVAGRREGLAGERSGLWFEFHRILSEARPRWTVVENVRGLLFSAGGRDFATVLQGLAELGYRTTWRVLDSQYFGVPQRRRRVFIVGHLGDGRSVEVLLESSCLSWDPLPCGPAGQTGSGAPAPADRGACGGGLNVLCGPVTAKWGKAAGGPAGDECYNLVIHPGGATSEKWGPVVLAADCDEDDRCPRCGGFYVDCPCPGPTQEGYEYTIREGALMARPVALPRVRRLTPTECERLQGFPDGWTAGFADTARYRMLGNAVTVPVAEWIGRRILVADRNA